MTEQKQREALGTEHFAARVPHGFRSALRQLVGRRMATTGQRISQGELLMELVNDAQVLKREARGGRR